MITFTGNQIRVSTYKATSYQDEIINLAIGNYGHLVGSRAPLMMPKQVTFEEFADIIEAAYDISNPQNGEVIRVLREVAILNAVLQNEEVAPTPVPRSESRNKLS